MANKKVTESEAKDIDERIRQSGKNSSVKIGTILSSLPQPSTTKKKGKKTK